MNRAVAIERDGPVGPIEDSVVLDFDGRHRRRIVMRSEGGLDFLLDLAQPARLKDGDVLRLDDGRRIAVRAAPEPLAVIRCRDLRQLARVAWHLGNRHLPTMLDGECLFIRRDHVIEDMVSGLGAQVAHVDAPFEPEGGAYAGGSGYGHSHHHHGHDHDH